MWREDGKEILYWSFTKLYSVQVKVKNNEIEASAPEALFDVRLSYGQTGTTCCDSDREIAIRQELHFAGADEDRGKRRISEIGLRMALGASRRGIVWLVLREVATMLLVGWLIGGCGSRADGHRSENAIRNHAD